MLATDLPKAHRKTGAESWSAFRLNVLLRLFTLLVITVCLGSSHAFAGATSFQEPTDWTVGDLNSTFLQWEAAPPYVFSATDTLPSSSTVSPALTDSSTMSCLSPGFASGTSGGYYSFDGDYQVNADVFNHGGSLGSGGPYPAGHGTRVLVQTSATLNPDFGDGVFENLIHIVQHDGSPIAGGENESKLQTTELFVGPILTSFGIVDQQELLFEFWLPDYTDDFRLQIPTRIHSSFNHLRIDTLISTPPVIDPDFDGSGLIDGLDFLSWQLDRDTHGGDAGFQAWEQAFGTPPAGAFGATLVPEPTSVTLLTVAILGSFGTCRPRQRKLPQGTKD